LLKNASELDKNNIAKIEVAASAETLKHFSLLCRSALHHCTIFVLATYVQWQMNNKQNNWYVICEILHVTERVLKRNIIMNLVLPWYWDFGLIWCLIW